MKTIRTTIYLADDGSRHETREAARKADTRKWLVEHKARQWAATPEERQIVDRLIESLLSDPRVYLTILPETKRQKEIPL